MVLMAPVALLVLADGRFPTGAHAHSGGLEQAVDDGRVHDLGSLVTFLDGRVRTAGRTDAAFAAWVVRDAGSTPLAVVDREARARCASPTLRDVGARLGRQLLRTAGRVWPLPPAVPAAPQPGVALGVVARAAGLDHADAALLACWHVATGPATAAVRLLGLDPVAVHGSLATLPALTEVAAAAAAEAQRPLAELPGPTATLMDIAAEHHRTREIRLFAS